MDEGTSPQEWAEALLTISAYVIALAAFSGWAFGLIAVPSSLVAAAIIRRCGLAPSPVSSQEI